MQVLISVSAEILRFLNRDLVFKFINKANIVFFIYMINDSRIYDLARNKKVVAIKALRYFNLNIISDIKYNNYFIFNIL